jgi:hypothetical protein
MPHRWLIPLAPLALGGCTAALVPGALAPVQGTLTGIEGAVTSGGALTPFTNLGNALALQELMDAHNLIYEAQQIVGSSGPISITTTSPVVTSTPSPTPSPPISPSPMPTPSPSPSPSSGSSSSPPVTPSPPISPAS